MCYRLAAELSDRIAAIAPVAGTMATDGQIQNVPFRSFLSRHGRQAGCVQTAEELRSDSSPSVRAETMRIWAKVDAAGRPDAIDLPDKRTTALP